MVFDVHVLGTASARPTTERAVSGSLVKGPEGIVVIDAGDGFQTRYATQRRHLKQQDTLDHLKPGHVHVLAFTHGHLDHTWGALPWLQSMDLEGRQTPLLVIGPTSASAIQALRDGQEFGEEVPPADLARQFLAWFSLGAQSLQMPIRWILGDVAADVWIELDPASTSVVPLGSLPQPQNWTMMSLKPIATEHTVPSCGWMIEYAGKAGAFDRSQAEQLGLSDTQRAQLARGEDITFPSGQKLHASSFRDKATPPVRVLLSGDTATCPPAWTSQWQPDLLIHEATFLNEHQSKADEHLHSTATGAVQSAQAIGAKFLALTHYSNRIKESEVARQEAILVANGLPVVALDDADRLQVNPFGEVSHLKWNGQTWQTNIPPNR